MFILELYFSESSLNAVDLFSRFLLSTRFPEKKIRLRPDNAKGFLNLKRSINAMNLKHSLPGKFYLEPDFARVRAPKDKVHLESSHRSLHNFEIRIIKAFEDRIVKTEPGYIFQRGRKEKITVTLLNIGLQDLRQSGIIESYRREHNELKHYFSDNGKTEVWIPEQKLKDFLSKADSISFSPSEVKELMKYGFRRIKATVSVKGTLTFDNKTYYVAVGIERFSQRKRTAVYISHIADKLFIFDKDNGILLGEALSQKPFEKPAAHPGNKIEANEVEQIAGFLKQQSMVIDMVSLIEKKKKGLTLASAKEIYRHNKRRYRSFLIKLNQPQEKTGTALFNAFIMDCERKQLRTQVAPYASYGE